MYKYLYYIKIQFAVYFAYTWNLIVDILLSFLGIIIILFVWNSIYMAHGSLSGYSFNSIVVYYLFVVALGKLVYSGTAKTLTTYIYNGTLATFQIRPANIRLLLFIEDFVNIFINTVISMIITSFCLFIFSGLWPSANISFISFMLFIPAYIFAVIINYMLYFIVGTAAFWTTTVGGLRITISTFIKIFTGALVPLTLFPNYIKNIISITPFPYLINFPINVITNNIALDNILKEYLIEILWTVILFLLCNILWKKGIKQYESIGN